LYNFVYDFQGWIIPYRHLQIWPVFKINSLSAVSLLKS